MKLAIALSGGVDSAVAGALLKEQGHELVGVTALVWPDSRCCDAQALSDAAIVAKALDIPYFTVEVMDEFRREVVDPFVDDYYHGRTPNPCPLCNTKIRFGTMWEKIIQQYPDCEAVATGHYAQISSIPTSSGALRWTLRKGLDDNKDQAYMLYGLSQEQLSRTLTPLGTYTKDQVRKLAEKFKLFVSKKPDSQDACFVSGDYKKFLVEYVQSKGQLSLPMAPSALRASPPKGGDESVGFIGGLNSPPFRGEMSRSDRGGPELAKNGEARGEIIDASGKVVGWHNGVFNFTIGQRKGLNLRRSGAENDPLFVIGLNPDKNQVVVGSYFESLSRECIVKDLNWIVPKPEQAIHSKVKIRYNADEVPAILTVQEDDRVHCHFEQAQRAVTPGQNAVFYDGDLVLGGGVIIGDE